MKIRMIGILGVVVALAPLTVSAHILAMVNYESKTAEGLKAHGIEDHGDRKEGLAVIDVDPGSKTFGKIMVDISLPPDRRRTAFWCAEKCANSEEQADSGRNGAELTIA